MGDFAALSLHVNQLFHSIELIRINSSQLQRSSAAMADKVASFVATTTPASPAVQAVPAKKGAAVPKSLKPHTKPAHPRTSEMVNAAISTLKERGGSSLQAIKKYITATYKIDGEKQAHFIKKYLKTAVSTAALVQTKGKGASGSFKISATKSETSKPKVKPATLKKKATSPAKKVSAAKKAAAAKKTRVASSVVTKEKRKVTRSPAVKPPKAKSSSRVKKVAKVPTSKPKAPKPKKATTAPKTAKPTPKKMASHKKK